MAIKARNQITVLDVSDAYNVVLSQDVISLNATATNKLNTAVNGVTVSASLLLGDTVVSSPTVEAGTPRSNSGATIAATMITTSVSGQTVTINFLAALNVFSGYIPITVSGDGVTLTKNVAFNVVPLPVAAYSYYLTATPNAIVKAEDGTLTPASITFAATSKQGTGSPAAYSGRFKIYYSTDGGSTWTAGYTSSSNESSKSYTIPTNVEVNMIKCDLHIAGATPSDANRLDSQTVPVISEGATGGQGEPAYTVILTNESHTFAAGTQYAIGSSIEVGIIAYKGATQVTATIGTITGTIANKLTAAVKANTNGTTAPIVTVTATNTLDTKSGELTIPVTVDGKTFNKKFSWALSLQGVKGDDGNDGEDAITLAVLSSDGSVFKNNTGYTILTAHVYKGGAEVTGNALSALGSISWYKIAGGVETAITAQTSVTGQYELQNDGSLKVYANGVDGKAIFEARLEEG